MSKLRFSKKFRKDSNASNIPEEQIKNKFDYNYNNYNSTYTKKYKNKYPSSRKYSKDSSNLSTSNEDIQENIQPPNFKAKASDFKIKYKTELCKYYELTGQCKFGNNCAYAHGIENLRSKVTNTTAYDNEMSYKKILEIISKIENVRNVKKLVEKPRLDVFKEITGDINEDENQRRLLDDIKGLDDFLEDNLDI